eukprot:3734703-Heterocapsa_arctica.AAC.1
MALKVFDVLFKVFDRFSGILAITVIFLAERSAFCTKSELENPILSLKSIVLSMHIGLCKTPLSCTPVRVHL